MRLPVCNFDIESDMLCPNCQAKLDRGEITEFDIQFSKWLLEKEKQYPSLDGLTLRKAACNSSSRELYPTTSFMV